MSNKQSVGTPLENTPLSPPSSAPTSDAKQLPDAPATSTPAPVPQRSDVDHKLSNEQFRLVLKQNLIKIVKYLVEGLVVSVACFLISDKLSAQDILCLGLIAASTFALIDTYAPGSDNILSHALRQGAGFTLGNQLVGGFGK